MVPDKSELEKKLSVKLQPFKLLHDSISYEGYWTDSLSEYNPRAFVHENWRDMHELDIRLFSGNSNILGEDKPFSLVYLLPGFPVLEILRIAQSGFCCDSLGDDPINVVRANFKKIWELAPFEILSATETGVSATFLQKITLNQVFAIEAIIGEFAPFSGDLERKGRRTGAARKTGFDVELRTL